MKTRSLPHQIALLAFIFVSVSTSAESYEISVGAPRDSDAPRYACFDELIDLAMQSEQWVEEVNSDPFLKLLPDRGKRTHRFVCSLEGCPNQLTIHPGGSGKMVIAISYDAGSEHAARAQAMKDQLIEILSKYYKQISIEPKYQPIAE